MRVSSPAVVSLFAVVLASAPVSASAEPVRDHDIVDDLQIKEVLALGLTYSIF